jgi:hypothetical protein
MLGVENILARLILPVVCVVEAARFIDGFKHGSAIEEQVIEGIEIRPKIPGSNTPGLVRGNEIRNYGTSTHPFVFKTTVAASAEHKAMA